MSVITKGVDASARIYGREVTFTSGTDFNVNDVVDIEFSIGGAGNNVTIECGAGASCTFRVNSLNRRYPLLPAAKRLGFPAPDLQTESQWINPDAPTYSLTAGQTMDLDGMSIANLEFTVLVDTVTVKARS